MRETNLITSLNINTMSTIANMRHALILICVYPINDVAFAICNEYRFPRSMNRTGRKRAEYKISFIP